MQYELTLSQGYLDLGREGDAEEGAFGFGGEDFDEAFVGLGEFVYQGQAQADAYGFPSRFIFAAVEFIEDFFALLVRHTGSVVLDLDEDIPVIRGGTDDDRFVISLAGIFDGVVDEVDDDLHDRIAVKGDFLQGLEILDDGKASLAGIGGHFFDDVFNTLIDIS